MEYSKHVVHEAMKGAPIIFKKEVYVGHMGYIQKRYTSHVAMEGVPTIL